MPNTGNRAVIRETTVPAITKKRLLTTAQFLVRGVVAYFVSLSESKVKDDEEEVDGIAAVGGMNAGGQKKGKLQRLPWTSSVRRFISTYGDHRAMDTVPTARMGEMGGGDVEMLRNQRQHEVGSTEKVKFGNGSRSGFCRWTRFIPV